MTPPRTCAFCETRFDASAAACPKCAYPADGAFAAVPARTPATPRKERPEETCPNCGGAFRAGRLACPHCGADATTGWKSGDELDEAAATLPEFDDEDYERVVREAHPGTVRLWTTRQVRVLVIGLILVAAMVVPLIVAFVRSR